MTTLKMITIEELLQMRANKQDFVLVDTLPADAYAKGHLPDAINIPSDRIAEDADGRLDKDAAIVTYCDGYTCAASTLAARKLLELGYRTILDFKAGKQGWTDAGFELET